MCRIKKYILLILMLSCTFSVASTIQDKNFVYQVGFGQNLNSYQWLTGIRYRRPFSRKGVLEVMENYNTSLIHLGDADNKWKDDQKLNINLFWHYFPAWKLKFSTAAFKFSDKFSGIASDINTNWATIGVVCLPFQMIELNSLIGYKYDARLDQVDRGATYHFEIKTTDSIPLKDYYNQFQFLTKGDEYSFRKNNDVELKYKVKKYFQKETYDSLSVHWTKKRRDNYDRMNPFDIFVESLEEENRGFNHFLSYDAGERLHLKLRTLINSRQTGVCKFKQQDLVEERSKKEFHSENEIGILFNYHKLELNYSLAYTTDNQKNEVPDSLKSSRFSRYFYYISPDYNSNRLTLSSYGKYQLSKSDTIQMKGAVSLFRYDTPENNMDDRDELRMNLHLLEVHYFSPQLKLVFNGSINLYHLVYIFSERSANNNWMRIFRLFPQVVYKPNERLTISQNIELLANYVDYDFETGISSADIRSYVFRRFAVSQKLNVEITKRSGIFISYKFEIEENGKFNWDRWTEILLMSRENHWLRANINYKIMNHFSVSPGMIFFKRTKSKQNNFSISSSLGGNMLSYGPTLKINYSPNENLDFYFEGMRRIIERSGMEKNYINYFNLRLVWYR